MSKAPSKKKNMVSISKKDLLKLLVDNEHYQKQIESLQDRIKDLKSQLAAAPKVEYIATVNYPPPPLPPNHPDLEPITMYGGARYEYSRE